MTRGHKDWRKQAKKFRRKRIRQKAAKDRDKKIEQENNEKLKDPSYRAWLKEQEAVELFKKETQEHLSKLANAEWLRREEEAQRIFKEERKRTDAVNAIKEAERERIKKEFEALKEKEKQRREEKIRQEEERIRIHKILVKKIEDYITGVGDIPSELKECANSNPGREECPFFKKTASCRHSGNCNKNHCRPGVSRIILLRHFFSHIQLDQSANTEYGNYLSLEHSDYDLKKDYDNFFEDICAEMEKFGKIINIRTCSNCLSHLRGNVFVEYEDERSAMAACMNLQGRYYASKQINVEFCNLLSWKTAVCGLSHTRKCPKGKHCNFLHIFKNPGNKYSASITHEDLSERRTPLIYNKNEVKTPSWNDIDSDKITERRNWRWSESPEKIISYNNLTNSKQSNSNQNTVKVDTKQSSSDQRKKEERRNDTKIYKHSDRIRSEKSYQTKSAKSETPKESDSENDDQNSSKSRSKKSSKRKKKKRSESDDSDKDENPGEKSYHTKKRKKHKRSESASAEKDDSDRSKHRSRSHSKKKKRKSKKEKSSP